VHGSGGYLVCVHEDHAGEGEPANSLVRVPLDGSGSPTELVSGRDFFACPRIRPDGRQLAWICWDHPNMPWNGTELWLGDLGEDGAVHDARCVAGGPKESIFQPSWSPDGELYFVSDRTDWWNLYRFRDGGDEAVAPMRAEFGKPQWALGMSTYGFVSPGVLVVSYRAEHGWKLARLELENRDIQPLEVPYTELSGIVTSGDRVAFVGGSPSEQPAVVWLSLGTGEREVVRRSNAQAIDPGYVSEPEPITFPTSGGANAHALFYPPYNQDYRGPDGARPPLIVQGHGGPTASASTTLSPAIQYWTSRGFAVVDVDYRGSTGYGRPYREALWENWGHVDVDDCVYAAQHLARQGRVDPERLTIRGGSAGGYTALRALTEHEVFSGASIYFGVSDLTALAEETHKFESRYLQWLVGPYPEARQRYVERSPIHAVDRLSAATIFFQGLDDRVVPPNQTLRMVEALEQKGLAVAYVPFEGEQHGFRRAENIKRALEANLYFYAQIFGFEPPEELESVPIANLGAVK
jgi:dipeptidyl aminopeptidase/acylaminoacyl peptidase